MSDLFLSTEFWFGAAVRRMSGVSTNETEWAN